MEPGSQKNAPLRNHLSSPSFSAPPKQSTEMVAHDMSMEETTACTIVSTTHSRFIKGESYTTTNITENIEPHDSTNRTHKEEPNDVAHMTIQQEPNDSTNTTHKEEPNDVAHMTIEQEPNQPSHTTVQDELHEIQELKSQCYSMIRTLQRLQDEEINLKYQNKIIAREIINHGYYGEFIEPTKVKRRRKTHQAKDKGMASEAPSKESYVVVKHEPAASAASEGSCVVAKDQPDAVVANLDSIFAGDEAKCS